jgi:hypothetical protein
VLWNKTARVTVEVDLTLDKDGEKSFCITCQTRMITPRSLHLNSASAPYHSQQPPQLQDTAALPVPQHVALNHLYSTAIKDMMVLGINAKVQE